jgi:hypothetical protein
MSTQYIGFSYVPDKQGDEGLVLHFKEGAAQTFKKGEPLQLSSGKVVIAAASPMGANALLGFAEKDASGVTDTVVPVRICRPGDVFNAHYESDDTFADADINTTGFDIKRKASGTVWCIDQDTVTNPKFLVLGTAELDARGLFLPTAGGPVYVKVKQSTATIFFAN